MDIKQKMINAINHHCQDLEDCIPTFESYGMTATAEEFRKAISELKESCVEDKYIFTQDNPDI